jgi:hypothetical protein
MSASWVAGAVRARAIARRRLGLAACRSLAGCAGLDDALRRLAAGPYGRDVHLGQTLVEAQRGVTAALLWEGRVLAGWLPRDGAQMMRVLAGWFEIENLDGLLDAFAGGEAATPYRLGSLATAWPRLARSRGPGELRQVLATTAWGDPGGDDDRRISLSVRLRWAARVRGGVPGARRWACGAAALLLGRELASGHRIDLPPVLLTRAVDADVSAVASVDELVSRLPSQARWAVTSARTLEELADAESAWWARVESDAESTLASARLDASGVVAVVILMAVDARRVRAALTMAAQGGTPLEEFDAVV